MAPSDSKTVRTISQILSFFSLEKEEIGVREVSQSLNVLPSSVHRLLSSLAVAGFLQKTEDRRYRLGERLFEVGALYPLHFPLRKIVRPHAEELARCFSSNGHVAIPSHIHLDKVISIDRIQNLQCHPLVQRLAFNVPIHCSGVGKAIFAFLEKEERGRILRSVKFEKYTPETLTRPADLRAELKRVAHDGYAVDRGEEWVDVWCVAAPIFQGGRVVGSLSVSDSRERILKSDIALISRLLKERAAFISRQLGG
jgi:IclR family transcriptional regulator, KDG regulon repressor